MRSPVKWTLAIAAVVLGATWTVIASNQQRNRNRELVDAVNSTDVSSVKSLLAEGADPNTDLDAGSSSQSLWDKLVSALAGQPKSPLSLTGLAERLVDLYHRAAENDKVDAAKRGASHDPNASTRRAMRLETRSNAAAEIVALLKSAGGK